MDGTLIVVSLSFFFVIILLRFILTFQERTTIKEESGVVCSE
jgi:hypothetical protein